MLIVSIPIVLFHIPAKIKERDYLQSIACIYALTTSEFTVHLHPLLKSTLPAWRLSRSLVSFPSQKRGSICDCLSRSFVSTSRLSLGLQFVPLYFILSFILSPLLQSHLLSCPLKKKGYVVVVSRSLCNYASTSTSFISHLYLFVKPTLLAYRLFPESRLLPCPKGKGSVVV